MKGVYLSMMEIVVAILQIIIAIGIIGFWLYFFKFENKNPERTAVYLGFERSFPVADLGWITPLLIISAVGLFLEEPFGIFFTVMSGSALVFLGLLDISFNLQQGGYKGKESDIILNLTINLICVIMGPLFLIYGWMNF